MLRGQQIDFEKREMNHAFYPSSAEFKSSLQTPFLPFIQPSVPSRLAFSFHASASSSFSYRFPSSSFFLFCFPPSPHICPPYSLEKGGVGYDLDLYSYHVVAKGGYGPMGQPSVQQSSMGLDSSRLLQVLSLEPL